MDLPKASLIAQVQAPIQQILRPAVWIPGLRNLHSHQEKWKFKSDSVKDNLDAILRAVADVAKKYRNRSYWDIHTVARGFLRIFVYTKAEWLDIIEISLLGKTAEVWSFSSGFLPLIVPFACILNVPLFWIPFADMGLNKKRIDQIVAAMDLTVDRH
ncbi:uncharacterized protein LOC131933403 isoform X2 [Physella acuta]|uniref:uncharacterized protein LOC131933403 isoform X2 n=1 Tax=Physella acuta TaxID=109671 RepID=UPI0027DC0A9B|nr:uncharacterized protein LOC131933403 isoform X2 [Physella acuta]